MTEVIVLCGVGKTYRHYANALDRLHEVISGKPYHREVTALQPLDLTLGAGEVVGIVGLNGAGKSTLLKLLAGTLQPSCGQMTVNGRVSALLELGTGFHPEMSGRENIYMSGAVLGLPKRRIDALYDEIVAFSGIGDFIDEPVKTYSSGMFVRLAFSVATCVEPDILIVDEALSVGDGIFARKSFDRIMQFKQAGKTILFCSHSLYQVEAMCDRALWIHQGGLMRDGPVADVLTQYNAFLGTPASSPLPATEDERQEITQQPGQLAGTARLQRIDATVEGVGGRVLHAASRRSDLTVRIGFSSDPALPVPSVAVALVNVDGRMIASAGTVNDHVVLRRDVDGGGQVEIVFPELALLKGTYTLEVYLMCENALHFYDSALTVAELHVHQEDMEQGVVSLLHQWRIPEAG